MMNAELYPEIFKRKSFHLFRGSGYGTLSGAELEDIRAAYAAFEPLYPDIRTAIRIVPAGQVRFRHDADYCILIYSEKKDNYLMNAGYLGEQLDLYLTAHGIGSLWFGIGKPDEPVFDDLDYVIMFAVRRVADPSLFRRDMFKAKRKPLEEIWRGDTLGAAEIARFAPSACNSQPWFAENRNGAITVYRTAKAGRSGIMPAGTASYFNRIDIGIFICILEICLCEKGIAFERELYIDNAEKKEGRIPAAVYRLR